MKLELYGLIQSLLDAGGKYEADKYVVRNWHGDVHRENGPAVVWPDGRQYWHQNGCLHREDGPAGIYPDGTQYWYQDGCLHRDNRPAVIYPDGKQIWYRDGKLHRDDGPAVIHPNGEHLWFRDDMRIYPTNPTPALKPVPPDPDR